MIHATRAQQNLRLSSLAPTKEWEVTMIYYAAVHAANHAIFGGKRASDNYLHTKRKQWLRTHWLPDVYDAYLTVEQMSRAARYEPWATAMIQEDVDAARRLTEMVFREAAILLEPNNP